MPRLYRRWSWDEYDALQQMAVKHERVMNAMKLAMETDDPEVLVEQIKIGQKEVEDAHHILSRLILGFVKDE